APVAVLDLDQPAVSIVPERVAVAVAIDRLHREEHVRCRWARREAARDPVATAERPGSALAADPTLPQDVGDLLSVGRCDVGRGQTVHVAMDQVLAIRRGDPCRDEFLVDGGPPGMIVPDELEALLEVVYPAEP